eukprot:GDKI01018375.1.p1 GENE.GDKI01018375.1~~GDKI01018375.1.p1  ORF type:complete len:327 (-),score=114.52 GDKI01018375.1:181-1161(-)
MGSLEQTENGYDAAAGYGPDRYATAAQAAVAKREAREHLEELHQAHLPARNVRIHAVPFSPLSSDPAPPSSNMNMKVVHFIRHGQGRHNVVAAESQHKCDCNTHTPSGNCPYLSEDLLDPGLTAIGRYEASLINKRAIAENIRPELIVVSPLTRATETAVIGFAHLLAPHTPPLIDTLSPTDPVVAAYTPHFTAEATKDSTFPPFIAHIGVNEQSGLHVCDRRRDVDALQCVFPPRVVDYSLLPSPKDSLWKPEGREPKAEVVNRGYEFMMWLRARPEKEIVVATHSAFLLAFFNGVLSFAPEHKAYQAWFATGEMRTVCITFEDL